MPPPYAATVTGPYDSRDKGVTHHLTHRRWYVHRGAYNGYQRDRKGMGLSLMLLGPFQVTRDGRPVSFATGASRALLAYLAVEADRAHPREHLSLIHI